MNFVGIGLLEVAVIFLVAFLVLGPNRSIDMARTVGKVLGDLRRTFSEVAAAANLEELEQTASRQDAQPAEPRESQPVDSQDEEAADDAAAEEKLPPKDRR